MQAQIFDHTGQPIGAAKRNENGPRSFNTRENTDFVIFNKNGSEISDVKDVSAFDGSSNDKRNPEIAVVAGGGFIIGHAKLFPIIGSPAYSIRANSFDANGDAIANETFISPKQSQFGTYVDIERLSDGSFLAVWFERTAFVEGSPHPSKEI